jgi:hypothetical protein
LALDFQNTKIIIFGQQKIYEQAKKLHKREKCAWLVVAAFDPFRNSGLHLLILMKALRSEQT